MLDDFYQETCQKHYGPVLQEEADHLVMRCSFCEMIYKAPKQTPCDKKVSQKSSKSCIQACDWFTEEKTVKCKSCGYTGPIP